MDTDQRVSLLSHGDQLEKETWTKLEPYLSKYEVVWRMQVVPLRAPGSIYLRLGINPNLETFAMNTHAAVRLCGVVRAERRVHAFAWVYSG